MAFIRYPKSIYFKSMFKNIEIFKNKCVGTKVSFSSFKYDLDLDQMDMALTYNLDDFLAFGEWRLVKKAIANFDEFRVQTVSQHFLFFIFCVICFQILRYFLLLYYQVLRFCARVFFLENSTEFNTSESKEIFSPFDQFLH